MAVEVINRQGDINSFKEFTNLNESNHNQNSKMDIEDIRMNIDIKKPDPSNNREVINENFKMDHNEILKSLNCK